MPNGSKNKSVYFVVRQWLNAKENGQMEVEMKKRMVKWK